MLLALNHGARHGALKTVSSGLGNLTGNLLMALISLIGLGALLIASGIVFNIIKWAGVAYLVYMGFKMLTEPVNDNNQNGTTNVSSPKNNNCLFIQGFLIAVSNPKGIIFFTALFPQFINTNNVTLNSFLIIFITLGVVAFGCYMLYAAFGARLNKLFRTSIFRKTFNRITGSLFIGMGLAIAFSKK